MRKKVEGSCSKNTYAVPGQASILISPDSTCTGFLDLRIAPQNLGDLARAETGMRALCCFPESSLPINPSVPKVRVFGGSL